MSYGSCLQRHFDQDLVDQILAHGKVQRQVEQKSAKHEPRSQDTYRGSRRNAPRRARKAMLALKRASKVIKERS